MLLGDRAHPDSVAHSAIPVDDPEDAHSRIRRSAARVFGSSASRADPISRLRDRQGGGPGIGADEYFAASGSGAGPPNAGTVDAVSSEDAIIRRRRPCHSRPGERPRRHHDEGAAGQLPHLIRRTARRTSTSRTRRDQRRDHVHDASTVTARCCLQLTTDLDGCCDPVRRHPVIDTLVKVPATRV